jgi:hypothetical protein
MSEEAKQRKLDGYFDQFNIFLKDLRIWFVAYGVGAPALFLTQPELRKAVSDSGSARCITLLFLAGVLLQVLSSFFGKWTSWVQYSHEKYGGHPIVAKAANWWAGSLWVDLSMDVGSLVVFAVATLKVLVLIT